MQRVIPLLIGAFLLAPPAISAQTQWEQQVLAQIRAAGQLFSVDGYEIRGDGHTGTLDNADSEDFSVMLESGVTYAFLGVCDEDCSDVDLSINDEYGELIDSDYQDDDVPVVEVTPQSTGRYTIHVYMADCTAEPCYYAVGTFASVAPANNEWEVQVEAQINTAGSLFSDEGYTQRREPYTGSLGQAGSHDFNVRLERGISYALLAVCDADCSDIDLMISDDKGVEVDSDYEDDDLPIVEVCPKRSGTYRVHVYMANCSNEPCYYGVGSFGKDQ